MELSPRLLKIASLVPEGARLADVGTDHGYIPLYLFRNNMISHAIAMDVNPMPLKKAEDNITDGGYAHMCEFRLSDGLDKLNKGETDVIVIAGMGGLLMRDILSRGKDVIDEGTRLLLQPMIAAPELRLFLFENGFTVDDEYVIREENKFYNIISARRGSASPTDADIYIGKNVNINSPDVYDDYISYKLRVCSNIIEGIQKSKNPDSEEIEKYQKQYALYKAFCRKE